ncbi:sugar ABC transporter ATP-binding protein [Emticicia sp. BO119]|uniref:sugar ABC transporter ATP-binding protein n=1 Tax=Emticicia sp. BO119 TaxID=2757768 RepID=UPI0015F0AF52|nr:sugar ABC transporter ATP-binding protein [Emticicia sp. BO119]MBA4850166.1 sugar ABC transporter ATP-binding protein [Emticicia sp. BO119]
MSQKRILEVQNLCKSFSGVKVLDHITFNLEEGEVHALMGENGAGKSTFMKILMGLLPADSGEIILDGEQIQHTNVHEMLKRGISMIHQEILMVPELTVAQNIFLGKEIHHFSWLNDAAIYKKTRELLKTLNVNIDANAKMKHLSIADKQMVEIAKAISNNAKIIIMDEPTSALSDKEVSTLFTIIKDLTSKGVAIIYISHKMDEIYQISDRITVLRDGQYIATKSAQELPIKDLISMMVGREIEDIFPKTEHSIGETIIRVSNLSQTGKFENINFEVKSGEVLGIAGLVGAGRTEVARAIAGLDEFEEGEIFINQEKVAVRSPKAAMKLGIGYVSEDRKALGFIPQLSIKQNITLSSLPSLSNSWFVSDTQEEALANQMKNNLKIKASSINQKLIYLSGGNQQKVVIAKVLSSSPQIIILDEPTRGIDIGAKFEIYKLINELKSKGLAVILISSELPEIFGVSDRILVLSKGKKTALLSRQEATQEKVMQYAIH